MIRDWFSAGSVLQLDVRTGACMMYDFKGIALSRRFKELTKNFGVLILPQIGLQLQQTQMPDSDTHTPITRILRMHKHR